MMAGLTVYAADAILNLLFRGTAFRVDKSWVQLHTGEPGPSGYQLPTRAARQPLEMAAPTVGVVQSVAPLVWVNMPDRATITHLSVWDADTGGNCLWVAALTAPLEVEPGDTFVIDEGAIAASLS